MQINKRQLKKWIAALDSGEYKQGRFNLQTGKKYCCLGVCCILVIPKSKRLCEGGRLVGGHPSAQPFAPKWLLDLNEDFHAKTGQFLTDLNDVQGFTFPEIATLLELVYVHKILD